MTKISMKPIVAIGFEYLMDEFLQSVEKESTFKTYRNQLQKVGEVLQEVAPDAFADLNNASVKDFKKLVVQLQKLYKSTTVKGQMATFKNMLHQAIEYELVSDELEAVLRKVKVQNKQDAKKQTLPTKQEVQKLKMYMERNCDTVQVLKMRLAVTIMLDSGSRISETLSIRWEAVDETKGIAWVNAEDTKSGKAYFIKLSPQALQLLDVLKQYQTSELVFDTDGKRMNRSTVAGYLKRMCKGAGIPNHNPHILRKFCATNQLTSGVPINVVSKYTLHHSSLAVTEKYILDNEEDALKVLDAYYN